MRRCNHESIRDAPIVDSFVLNGKTVNTRCRGDLNKIILDMKLLTRTSLPVNGIALQERTITNGVESVASQERTITNGVESVASVAADAVALCAVGGDVVGVGVSA